MSRPVLFAALMAATLAMGVLPAGAKTDPAGTLPQEESQSMSEVIREKLSAQGYKDITVMPTSYAVSATDENGKPVLLLIGPQSSSKLPETAQSPPGKEDFIQQ